ncbi:copper amine oxidase N-terminal domain-containing protein [Paenibacillus thermoaerophilus]|jgi:hypothetical protein|uniref:Copper amine oxidase N-terminal domain-containing protein n=1 Tax=Paenibacillus thermoaerophilus TaxID=1215385 RepID=A0ABW2UZH9_9BACL|nr:copper amine oxidase N-terminal domain-containing protein [Paenibacillus thermoaerophilus]TMV14372.1 copper amine oxidase N-terminal domain-containing protein [Paenibacillus thermoaerophilus]
MALSRIRRFAALSLPIALVLATAAPMAAAASKNNASIIMRIGSTSAQVGSDAVELEVAPVMTEEQVTLVPLRFVVDSLEGELEWDPDIQLVTISHGGREIQLYIGKEVAYVDGNAVELDAAPEIVDGVTMVPVRFVSENLGQRVEWLPDTNQIVLHPE